MRVIYKTVTGRKIVVECKDWAHAVTYAHEISTGQVPFRILSAVMDGIANGLIDATNKTARLICQ